MDRLEHQTIGINNRVDAVLVEGEAIAVAVRQGAAVLEAGVDAQPPCLAPDVYSPDAPLVRPNVRLELVPGDRIVGSLWWRYNRLALFGDIGPAGGGERARPRPEADADTGH